MATQPTYAYRTGFGTAQAFPRAGRHLFELRALPHESVFFYRKAIDNSRLVRESDPKSRGACWSAIGVAGIVVALLFGVLAPSVADTLSGYKLQSLRGEEQRLLDERRTLELAVAQRLSPEHLARLADRQNLVTPRSGQVLRLDGDRPDASVAMVK
jgi:hypothetical protein